MYKSTKGLVAVKYTISAARCANAVNLLQYIVFCQIYDEEGKQVKQKQQHFVKKKKSFDVEFNT